MNLKDRVARLRRSNPGVRVFGAEGREIVLIDFAEVQSLTAWQPTACVVRLRGGAEYTLTCDTAAFLTAFEREAV